MRYLKACDRGRIKAVAIIGLICIIFATLGNSVLFKPELVRNLPSRISEAETEFDLRIKRQFPLGSSERELIQILTSQGFTVTNSNSYAVFKTFNFACRLNWVVKWKTNDSNQLTKIEGKYNTVCL